MKVFRLKPLQHILVKTLLIAALAALGACGGGGGGGGSTTPTSTPDTIPNAFSFTALTDQPLATQLESASVTISGINQSVPVAVTGGEYSIAGGAFTSANGTISSGQTLVLRGTSSSEFETETTITVTVSSLSQSFTITTLAQDITPESFDLGASTDAALGASVESTAVTVAGITGAVLVSITNGTYTIDGGTPSSDAGTIEAGQEIQVQVLASDAFNTPTTASLTIGEFTETFTVTTLVEDTDPDAFDLGIAEPVSVPGTVVESTPVAIAGINSPASIAISDGEYRIVGVSDYSSSPSTIALGQQVQVRVTAPAELNQTATATATLTIGDQSDTFSVRTQDMEPPVAEVIFPTPNTMSDGSSVTLRGKASDDFGVAQINVVVTTDDGTVEVANETITAGAGEDYEDTWSVNVALGSEKLNTITVSAIDVGGNTQETPVELTVLQAADALTTSFPVGDDVVIGDNEILDLAWDRSRNRLLLAHSGNVFAVDIATGQRSLFINDPPDVATLTTVTIDEINDTVFISDQNAYLIFAADLATAAISHVSGGLIGSESNVSISDPYGMSLGSDGNLYVSDVSSGFYRVNIDTGFRTLISNNTVPDAVNPINKLAGNTLDEANNRALVSDYGGKQLMWVDLTTGARTVLVDSDQLAEPFDIHMDEANGRILLVDGGLEGMYAVDPVSGDLTVLSNASKPASGANSLEEPWGFDFDAELGIAFVRTNSETNDKTSVKLVDLTSGERIILTNSIEE